MIPGMTLTLSCTVDGCDSKSEPCETYHISRYDYHDAPDSAVMYDEAIGWWVETLFEHAVICPNHLQEFMTARRKRKFAHE